MEHYAVRWHADHQSPRPWPSSMIGRRRCLSAVACISDAPARSGGLGDRQWCACAGAQFLVDVVVVGLNVTDARHTAQGGLYGAVPPCARVLFGVEQVDAARGTLRVVVGPQFPDEAG